MTIVNNTIIVAKAFNNSTNKWEKFEVVEKEGKFFRADNDASIDVYVGVYEPIAGHKAYMAGWDDDMNEYDILETGTQAYPKAEMAEGDAEDWAKAEDVVVIFYREKKNVWTSNVLEALVEMKTEWEDGTSIQDSAITEEQLRDSLRSEIEDRAGVDCPEEVLRLLPKKEDLVVIETRCSLPASGGHGIGYGPMYISRAAAVKAGFNSFVACECCHSYFDRTIRLKDVSE